MTFIPAGHPERFEAMRESDTFKALAGLAALRAQIPALEDRRGKHRLGRQPVQ